MFDRIHPQHIAHAGYAAALVHSRQGEVHRPEAIVGQRRQDHAHPGVCLETRDQRISPFAGEVQSGNPHDVPVRNVTHPAEGALNVGGDEVGIQLADQLQYLRRKLGTQVGAPDVTARDRVEDGRAAVGKLRVGQSQLMSVLENVLRLAAGGDEHGNTRRQPPDSVHHSRRDALIRPDDGPIQIKCRRPNLSVQFQTPYQMSHKQM